MLIRHPSNIPSSEITPESIYLRRREFMQASALGVLAMAVPYAVSAAPASLAKLKYDPVGPAQADSGFYTKEALTPFEDVTSYNNFYEFGTSKTDPSSYADALDVSPWSVSIEGEVEKPGVYDLDDILKKVSLEERVYRLRCVEAWSMVIPWIGFPLADLIKQFQPTSKAKYIQFETLYRPEEMRGQGSRFGTIDWPYVEGLRMDEAMHPLALMATGLYGKALPNQNGAPLRLVVPWKYGFKSIKSIVKIRFVERQPKTSWETTASQEYGFYANVNPAVDHPRWSQKHERRLPSTLFSPNRIKTLPFNGYGDQVASLYSGMDLTKYY